MDELKSKPNITRQDIADLLKSIGEPGEKRQEKIDAVRELGRTNFQQIDVADSLNSYGEF